MNPAENHCCAQEARLKGAATLRPTDKLVQNSAEQGSSPSSGQFFPYLIFPAACSSPLTHPILNISRAQRAANLSTLLQLPPVSSSFFPHRPNSRNEENRYFPFFFSLSFLFLPFLAPFSRKNSSFSISFLPQNGISSRPCEARASIQILIKARPREKCMRLKSTRLRFEGRPRLNRSSIVFLFFPFFSPSPLSIWLRFCSSCFRQNPRALIIENHCNPISLLGGAI